jgi:hypothetical protein
MMETIKPNPPVSDTPEETVPTNPSRTPDQPESGGQKGPEPTRYRDWEKNGICTDF